MNCRNILNVMGMAFLAVFFTIEFSKAQPVALNVSQLALISPGDRNPDSSVGPRVLLKFDLPEEFRGRELRSAWVEFEMQFPLERDDSTLVLRICPLTRNWEEGEVNWSSPWETPGGDFADSLGQTYFTQAGLSRQNRIDVTEIYNLYAGGIIGDHGLILKIEYAGRRAFRLLRQLPGGFRSAIRLVVE